MIRYCLALCLFLTVSALWAAEKKGTPPSYRLYQTELPAAFRSQVRSFVTRALWQYPHLLRMSLGKEAAKTRYQKQTADFLLLVQEQGSDLRAWHERFIHHFRSLTSGEQEASSPLSRDIAAFLDAFAIWVFSEDDLSDAFLASYERDTGFKPIQDQKRETMDISKLLGEAYEQHRHMPKYVGYDKENYLTEILLEGNMPLVVTLFDLPGKKVPIMRSGTMVRDLAIDEISQKPPVLAMSPEFTYYLLAQAKKGKTHLYVNFMRQIQHHTKQHDVEDQRTRLIEQLEMDPATGKTARVITLDKNSPFYYQEGPFSDLNEVAQFKRQFLANLTQEGPTARYYWSKHLDAKRWKETLNTIVEQVHQRYFGSKAELSAAERSGFIELAYLKIVEAAIQQLNVDAVNISCRHCIDRAASFIGLFYFDQLLKQSPTLSGEKLSRLMAFVYAPGLFFHDRPIHVYRVEILQSAAAALQKG
ncbi:MAG: hypothetical protein LLG04_01575 [Parachlamydia sp.]|nr:hypothetical protein [Parachlamydia sp.]